MCARTGWRSIVLEDLAVHTYIPCPVQDVPIFNSQTLSVG